MTIKYEIVETPYCALLHGFGGSIVDAPIPVVGKRLMDDMWQHIQSTGIKSKGLNHWVYLPDSKMFVGVELIDPSSADSKFEQCQVHLPRYLKHVHLGPYSELPSIWPELMSLISDLGERPMYPNLEIYGHWNPDPAQCETTIIIGLQKPQ